MSLFLPFVVLPAGPAPRTRRSRVAIDFQASWGEDEWPEDPEPPRRVRGRGSGRGRGRAPGRRRYVDPAADVELYSPADNDDGEHARNRAESDSGDDDDDDHGSDSNEDGPGESSNSAGASPRSSANPSSGSSSDSSSVQPPPPMPPPLASPAPSADGVDDVVPGRRGPRFMEGSTLFGISRLTSVCRRGSANVVTGWQLTCPHPRHAGVGAACTKTRGINFAGGEQITLRMLKWWMVLGEGANSKADHKSLWDDVVLPAFFQFEAGVTDGVQVPTDDWLEEHKPAHNSLGSIASSSGNQAAVAASRSSSAPPASAAVGASSSSSSQAIASSSAGTGRPASGEAS